MKDDTDGLPISGIYVSTEELSRTMHGDPDSSVLGLNVAITTGHGLLRQRLTVSRRQLTSGIAKVMVDESLTRDIIKYAYEVSDLIDSGVDKAPEQNPYTDRILEKFDLSGLSERRPMAVNLVHLVVSVVVRNYFGRKEQSK